MLSVDEINLLYGQNKGLRIQNEELQRELLNLRKKVLELENEIRILREK